MNNQFECSICLNENISINNLCLTNCNHNFCKDCLDNWLNNNKKTCPLCISEINNYKYKNDNYNIIYHNSNTNSNSNLNNNLNNVVMINKNTYILMNVTIFALLTSFVSISYIYFKDYYNDDNINI